MEKYAVIGNGGREHALAIQLQKSDPGCEVISLPGNPGMAEVGECFHVPDLADAEAVAEIAAREGVDLAVVGPEVPLVAGLVDELNRREIAAFGPDMAAARLEGSKAFMKRATAAAGIPTAEFKVFRKGQERQAHGYYESFPGGAVIKTDGLAAGKGVALPRNANEARRIIREYLSGSAFGEAGERIVIERRLKGREISLFALCDGDTGVALGTARDYKRLRDGDAGPNTGGMGSYAPIPDVSSEFAEELMEIGVTPMLRHLNEQGSPYRGILYAGFMLTEDGPMVLEYNIRFGDPEAQVIVPRIASSLGAHCREAAAGKLVTPVELTDGAAVTVALAVDGYPEKPRLGDRIEGMADAQSLPDVEVYFGGITGRPGDLVTTGGRVAYPTGFGDTIPEARDRAYQAAEKIDWPGLQRRSDIAADID